MRGIEMEQHELRYREMKTNLSINQQQQQKDVKTNRRDSAGAGVKVQKWIGRDLWKQFRGV